MNKIDITPIKRLNSKHIENVSNVDFDSMEEYILLAEKLINIYGNRIRSGLSQEMLNNEDMVSNMATELMSAELSYNGVGTIYGYRKQIAKWVIYEYIARKSKSGKYSTFSIDLENSLSEESYKNILPSNALTPDEVAINNESKDIFVKGIKQMIKQKYISNVQGQYLTMYYLDGLTMTEIAAEKGVGRQAVSIAISRALQKLRKNTGWTETTTFSGYNE